LISEASKMIQTTRNYKSRGVSEMLEAWGTPLAWLAAAGLLGWVIALLLGVMGDREAAKLAPWKPAAPFSDLAPRQAAASTAVNSASSAPWQFVGIADDRVYVRSGNQPMSFAAGEKLPNGDLLRRVEKDAIVVASGDTESRIALYKFANAESAKSSLPASAANAANAAAATSTNGVCRLSATDKAQATWIEPAVAAALGKEQATFARIFVPLIGTGEGAMIGGTAGGVRAQATGGTTAMFGIQDGDTLLRADGKSITSGMSVINDVIARVQRGEAVVVDGERGGATRRWVFAPVACRS
jgi:hypothetical protein